MIQHPDHHASWFSVQRAATLKGLLLLIRAEKCDEAARSGAGLSSRPWICRQLRLLEHIDGLPAQCTSSNRFLGHVWQKAQGQVLDDINLHRNLWVGRVYVVQKSREFGCKKKMPGLETCLETWTMCGSSENLDPDVRRLGPRQGTSVHFHTVVDVDQFCHKLIPPFLQRWSMCGAGSHPF